MCCFSTFIATCFSAVAQHMCHFFNFINIKTWRLALFFSLVFPTAAQHHGRFGSNSLNFLKTSNPKNAADERTRVSRLPASLCFDHRRPRFSQSCRSKREGRKGRVSKGCGHLGVTKFFTGDSCCLLFRSSY